jgi:hypothetical protein
MRLCLAGAFVLMAVASFGCAGSTDGSAALDRDNDSSTPSRPNGSTGGGSNPGTGNTPPIFTPSPSNNNPSAGCSTAAQLVYVISDKSELYSFSPNTKAFNRVGALKCNAGSMVANSMAIDRNATAWVNYVSLDTSNGARSDLAGSIFKVNTKDGSCEGPVVTLPAGYYRLGMGFSTEGANSTNESLFVTATRVPGYDFAASGASLARLNLTSGQVSPIGNFPSPLAQASAELAGTGDGKLFGFFTTSPATIAPLGKTSGTIEGNSATISDVAAPAAWAFAFWGGSFYLFTGPSNKDTSGKTTNVAKYNPADGSTDAAYMNNIGFRVVGAGVSTCAPLAPPR